MRKKTANIDGLYLGSNISLRLQPEVDGQHHAHGDGLFADLAHTPLGHRADDADGLTVQALVARSTNHAHVTHLAIGTHNEAAQDTALDALLVGMIRIFAGLVDEVDQRAFPAGELGLDIDIIKLIHLHIGAFGRGIDCGTLR